MRYLTILLFLLSLANKARSQQTQFEKSDGKQTATYFQAIEWYKELDKKSPEVLVKEMGPTDAGYPLHLVLVSKDHTFDPASWHRQKKIVIFINNGIHPGEPDGIDASMMLLRDIAQGKVVLPENVALAFIPVYNIGGCLNRNSYTRANQNGPEEYGFRGNAQNLDLNRDFTKSDSKNAASFAKIFHWLNPEILIDNHVSDGADYQHTMTLISTQYNKLGPVLGAWLRDKFEPALYQGMAKKNWELIPYVDFETTDFGKGMQMFYDPPRYSSGYAALFNTLSFMPETHMLKPYKQRVRSTYDLMITFIEQASANAKELLEKRAAADNAIKKQTQFALKWKPDTSVSRKIIFKGYERDTMLSEATGLKKMFYNHQKPFTNSINYFDLYIPADTVAAPKAYVIPQGWYDAIDRLLLNGVTIQRLKADTLLSVMGYHIDKYQSSPTAYEKHHKNFNVQVSKRNTQKRFLKGDYVIYLDQPAKRYLVEMLEPTGDDSFFAWNFFDAILQQKEGYSDYRWEDIAAKILKNDPVLSQKLAQKKASDTKFANDSHAILNFIYKNSSYYEAAHLQYPVYRIE
ncbi:hypothetical protein GS399_06780 [Pedobacter sp. HMF7647]|uniref:Peptidase M14 domain-containing protein n=1 Tax=Hufsiella arboris TaxID=2695275 RepID=A0A7K1Y7W2_9SPHI|nr:M14 family metallopeptidase [Hufsiella arboris]MXV50673.1 hypothetical protein [Hufsiella arboris]